ncbi:MAG: four helix bundle protein [Phycisphaerales bacterium]|nr:four helix bundle protein [Phycisphaerales bacterium]
MGRLGALTLERVEAFGDRVLDEAEALQKQRRFGRVIDQLAGCGTSSGANVYEADEAMTRKDFAKSLGIVVKELNETKYWLRLVSRRGWIKPSLLLPLIQECEELKSVFGSMIVRTRAKSI